MRKASYVDKEGNPINEQFESKKGFLNLFFVIGTLGPLIIIGFMIYAMVDNNKCSKIYDSIKKATLEYINDSGIKPSYEGESTTVSINKLYSNHFLSSTSTNDRMCGGQVKVTKYKKDLVYTLDVNNCESCSVNNRYKGWSSEINYLPTNKTIVDVVPYYNYYERQVSATDWSKEYTKDQIENKKSKYGVKMPIEQFANELPKVPAEGKVAEVQTSEKTQYRYKDAQWKWYDVPGNYSDFSSEQPAGYANKDNNTKIYTAWTKYSLDHPDEKEYRDVQQTTGYKCYYEENGKKQYVNNGKYTAYDDIDHQKYDKCESDTSTLYRYRDSLWRWYNGTPRHYSSLYSLKPSGYNYRDDGTKQETLWTSWSDDSSLTPENKSYRTEETRILTRYRYIYEILSLPLLDKPINREDFTKEIAKTLDLSSDDDPVTIPEFATFENYKVEVSYKFKYRKR